MAKQIGIHGLKGKVDGMSYYSSKNGGRLTRSINEGMSSRVKTAQEYSNTRKNNSEFGMCGDLAGAIIKTVSLRWRFILDSIATGKMVKILKELVVLDTTGKWGERVVKDTNNLEILSAFNSFSKNQAPSDLVGDLSEHILFDAVANKIFTDGVIMLSAEECERLASLGATGVKSISYVFGVTKPQYDQSALAYTKAVPQISVLPFANETEDFAPGAPVNLIDTDESADAPFEPGGINQVGGILTVILPYRKVGGAENTLQQLCYACWTVVPRGTVPEP